MLDERRAIDETRSRSRAARAEPRGAAAADGAPPSGGVVAAVTAAFDRPRRMGVLIAFCLWPVAFTAYFTPGAAMGSATPAYIAYLALCAAIGVTLCSLAFLGLERAMRLRGWRRAAVAASAVGAGLLTHAVLDTIAAELILGLPKPRPGALLQGRPLLFLFNLLQLSPAYLTYAIVVLLGFSLRAVGERELRLAAALNAAQEAQLAALRFQINPHFLFNSLNAVSSLVTCGRAEEAQAVVSRLAAFFRETLQRPPTELVTLEEECDFLAAYLDIERIRFGDRLAVDIELPLALRHAQVPHLLLQPLAENAVKHAVAVSRGPVRIAIAARRLGDGLEIAVRDDGPGAAAATHGAGMGLTIVAQRLLALYGEAARLEAQRTGRGFCAAIRMPLDLASVQKPAA